MKCLIIAAGRGSRLSEKGDSKPLIPILGVPLLERVIRAALEGGANEFLVVTGYRGNDIRDFLNSLEGKLSVPITAIHNGEWEKENGLSVLKAQKYLDEPFLLSMSDHLFDPSIIRDLLNQPLPVNEIILGVDMGNDNPLVDMDDVTKVKIKDGKIIDIDKKLLDFDGFDTGIFCCTPAIFQALVMSEEKNGDTSLSGAIRILAGNGKAGVFDIGNRFWVDVDDASAFARAEKALMSNLRDKASDGPISRWLNRPLSMFISRRLVNTNLSPNQISLLSFLFSLLAAGLFSTRSAFFLFLGGVLAQFASVIDGCDGEVARLKFQASAYGGWLDAVLDRYADAFLLFGLTWYLFGETGDGVVLWIGFLAIIGSFVLSYSADKYDSLMKNQIRLGASLRLGRDVRVFIIFLGAIFNQVYITLIIIAVLMNLEVIRRVLICRKHE